MTNTGNNNTGNRNTGNNNKGNWNTGNSNTGNFNTGKNNKGDINTGDFNTGDYNTGNRNKGEYNTGEYNKGNWNTGNSNTGYWNTGSWNTGYWNTGHSNTGYCNTGNWNTGHSNTGDWNTGHSNTGYCNSITPDECFIFNKPGLRSDWYKAKKPEWMYVYLTKWIDKSQMCDKEKKENPSYETTGGYLKRFPSLKEAYMASWENTTEEDRELTRKLPNFSEEVFEEVFGFNPWEKNTKTIVIDGQSIEISKESYEEIKKSLLR